MTPIGVISGDHRQEMTPIGVIFGDHRQKMTLIGVILSGPEMTPREQMTRLSMAESFRTGGKNQKSFESHFRKIHGPGQEAPREQLRSCHPWG